MAVEPGRASSPPWTWRRIDLGPSPLEAGLEALGSEWQFDGLRSEGAIDEHDSCAFLISPRSPDSCESVASLRCASPSVLSLVEKLWPPKYSRKKGRAADAERLGQSRTLASCSGGSAPKPTSCPEEKLRHCFQASGAVPNHSPSPSPRRIRRRPICAENLAPCGGGCAPKTSSCIEVSAHALISKVANSQSVGTASTEVSPRRFVSKVKSSQISKVAALQSLETESMEDSSQISQSSETGSTAVSAPVSSSNVAASWSLGAPATEVSTRAFTSKMKASWIWRNAASQSLESVGTGSTMVSSKPSLSSELWSAEASAPSSDLNVAASWCLGTASTEVSAHASALLSAQALISTTAASRSLGAGSTELSSLASTSNATASQSSSRRGSSSSSSRMLAAGSLVAIVRGVHAGGCGHVLTVDSSKMRYKGVHAGGCGHVLTVDSSKMRYKVRLGSGSIARILFDDALPADECMRSFP